MSLPEVLSAVGAVLGPTGAVLVASSSAGRRAAGFACWLVSNVALMFWAQATDAPRSLLLMWAFYFVTASVGFANNLPRRQP